MVTLLAKVFRSGDIGQGDRLIANGGEKDNLIPPMLLAGLISLASKSKRSKKTLTDTKLGMDSISLCGSSGLVDYKHSQTNKQKRNWKDNLT